MKQDAIDENKDFFVRDVCRATAAAPSYFEAATVSSIKGLHYTLVDGGVFANNPSVLAYAEAKKVFHLHQGQEVLFVSLGTGSQLTPLPAATGQGMRLVAEKFSVHQKGPGKTEETEEKMKAIFSTLQQERNYFRIRPDHLGNASLAPDDARASNLTFLMDVGQEAAASHDAQLDEIVDALLP